MSFLLFLLEILKLIDRWSTRWRTRWPKNHLNFWKSRQKAPQTRIAETFTISTTTSTQVSKKITLSMAEEKRVVVRGMWATFGRREDPNWSIVFSWLTSLSQHPIVKEIALLKKRLQGFFTSWGKMLYTPSHISLFVRIFFSPIQFNYLGYWLGLF